MKYRTSPETLMQKVGEESVILDLRGGTYYGLDPIGTRVWETLAAGSSIEALLVALTSEYEVPIETLRNDVEKLIADLVSNGLLTRSE
jgi:hypothetical protein